MMSLQEHNLQELIGSQQGEVDPSPRGVFHAFASCQLVYVHNAVHNAVYHRCTGTAGTTSVYAPV